VVACVRMPASRCLSWVEFVAGESDGAGRAVWDVLDAVVEFGAAVVSCTPRNVVAFVSCTIQRWRRSPQRVIISPVQEIRFVRLSPAAMSALVEGDLDAASASTGVKLTSYLVSEAWLWRIRLEQVEQDPPSADWVARAAVAEPEGVVVGHGGFHGPPDADGTVEVAYSVDPAHRRRGYATAMLAALLRRAEQDPSVRAVRASIQPDNAGSLATIAKFGFRKVGEQWDAVDGLEYVYLREV
jgi:RimJ/RimL family protein N-acetyltransferase